MKQASEAKSNPKAVWKYANSNTKNREGVSDLNVVPNYTKFRLTYSDREKADVIGHFLKFFYCRTRR